MEDDSSLLEGLKNDPLSIIDENPELTTLILATKLQNEDNSSLSSKILSKLSRGYTCYTVVKIISYSFAETAFILPYCLKTVGILPYCLGLILISLISFYFFYIQMDLVIKFNLFQKYHGILKENLSRKFTLVYYIINILYHSLILILGSYIFLYFIIKLLSLFDFGMGDNIIYYAIILLELVLVQFPLSFINYLNKPDLLFIIFIIFFFLLNIISFFFFIIYRYKKEDNESTMNFFEEINTDYFTCFSVLYNIIGWQNQISRQLEEFKIKTTRRLFNILYLTFILEILFCLIIGLVNVPLMVNNEQKIFIINYNEEIIPTLMIKIVLIICCVLINVLISYRVKLIEENFILLLEVTIYKSSPNNTKKINKITIAIFKLFILLLCSLINLVINDISYIVILFGGILANILNFLFPTIIYSKLISKNNLVIKIAFLLSIFVIIINFIGLILKIIFESI